MGKDQDFIEAARCGNFAVVERILNHRAKKSGPLASLRRGPGPNVQDNSGFTPLHHACLNGHKDIVALLLRHDASLILVDNKGCTPLHLASWSGNVDIVKLLLDQRPWKSLVNHMNLDHESALHSAAQYGHTDIVKLLLENHCYPSVRNMRNESPLDLASQYGRLETVELLLKFHPSQLSDVVRCHSPLHLAARNGHKHVVKLLLDFGFDINQMTDVGTALHEAAMYGKIDVVTLLLDYGIDPNLENFSHRTVFDILSDLNSSSAKHIEEIIKNYTPLVQLEVGGNDSLSPIFPPHGFRASQHFSETLIPEKSLSEISPPRQFCSPTYEDTYDHLQTFRPSSQLVNRISRTSNSVSSVNLSQSDGPSYENVFKSHDSSLINAKVSIYESHGYEKVDIDDLYEISSPILNANDLFDIPPPLPCFLSSKRFSDPMQQCTIYQNVPVSDKLKYQNKKCNLPDISPWTIETGYIPLITSDSCVSQPQPPAKPPRKSVGSHLSEIKIKRNSYENIYIAKTDSSVFLDRNENNQNNFNCDKAYQKSEYLDMNMKGKYISIYQNHELCSDKIDELNKSSGQDDKHSHRSSTCKFSDVFPISLLCEEGYTKGTSFNNLMPSKSTPALHASRHTLDQVVSVISKDFPFHKSANPNFVKRASVNIPTSPSSYNQPTTPDNPPPSPGTADLELHNKLHPAGQELKKKKSCDGETLTDEQLVATLGLHGELELTLATNNKSVSTEVVGLENSAFDGLKLGSVQIISKNTIPIWNVQNKKINTSGKPQSIYDNVQVAMEEEKSRVVLSVSDSAVQGTNCNYLSAMSPFDEKAEWAEIAGIVASFGGSIARETLLLQDSNSLFTTSINADSRQSQISYFNNLEQWLAEIELSQYENLLEINGFDNSNFLAGILEDADLQEIGIHVAEDRQKLLNAAQKLPQLQPINKFRGTENFPASVEEWLKSINLLEYSESFSNNNITDMNRVLKLWEVELNTVLKIFKLGHRKRILASLGNKLLTSSIDSKEWDLSKLTLDLSELEVSNDKKKHYSLNSLSANNFQDPTSGLIQEPHLNIESPSQLMNDSRNPGNSLQHSTIAPWCHHPDELVINQCNYMAKYLGSTLVKEVNGLESTKKSIKKLKTSTKDIAKIPSIILSISSTGVKFINAETQQLVCEHEIRNIHCVCQDADDFRHFAYITKEHQTHNHYCHVFSSHSVEMASEIILTLGQAFEVAYQLALKAKYNRACNPGQENHNNSKTVS